jgi:hypothetical protein
MVTVALEDANKLDKLPAIISHLPSSVYHSQLFQLNFSQKIIKKADLAKIFF